MRTSLPIIIVAFVLAAVWILYYLSHISTYSWDTIVPLFATVAMFLAFLAVYLRLGEAEHERGPPTNLATT